MTLVLGCEAKPEESGHNKVQSAQGSSALSLDLSGVEGDIDLGGGDVGSGVFTSLHDELKGHRSSLSTADLDIARKQKGSSGVGEELSVPTSWRSRLKNSAVGGGETARLLLQLPDTQFPWHELRNKALSEETRAEIVNLRQTQLKNQLDALQNKLSLVGGSDFVRFWIVPALSVRVPASAVGSVADWEELEHGSWDENQTGKFLVAYSPGYEGRNGMRDDAFYTAGYRGGTGHAYGSSTIRAGLWDSGEIAFNHIGFKVSSTLASRFIKKTNCDYGTCVPYTPTEVNSHGTAVAGIMGGSIEGGQDSNYTTLVDRKLRSGIASAPSLYYYSGVSDPYSAATAVGMMQQSTTDGLDVMNHSYSWGNCSSVCDRTCDKTGFNNALTNSTNAGTLHVFAAGNDNTDNTTCTLVYPGQRRDGLTVGALSSTNNTVSYDSLSMASYSSRGGMDIKINGAIYSRAISGVDLVAPGSYTNTYTWTSPGTSSYDSGYSSGTSYASPSVAGSAIQLLNSFYSLGWSGMNARMTQTYLLMMADGWAYESSAISTIGMDKRSGAGRLHNHYMSSSNLTAPWGWGCHQGTISSGQTISYGVLDSNPESTSITTWKAALTWQEDNYDNAADLDLKVYDICPPGGGEVLVAQDISADLRSRVRLTASSIGGKCLQYRVIAYFVPASTTRTFTACDYFQSGSASDN